MKTLSFTALLLSFAAFGQNLPVADFLTAEATIRINPYKKLVEGEVTYQFKVLKKTDSIWLDANKMDVLSVYVDYKKIPFKNSGSRLSVFKKFKADKLHHLKINYKTHPEQAMYFIGWEHENAEKQVWTQGQGKYTSHWLPGFDDVNEKVEFDLNVVFDKNFEVIANGNLIKVVENDSLKTWHFDMDKPMSSYLLAVAIGNYRKITNASKSGVPIELYYYPKDSLKVEPTYRYTTAIFDFLEDEIGVPYPWQIYKQIPVKDFLYAGMENTTATLFSDSYVVDYVGFTDKNYVNVNAHELAHQWFGNLVTAKSGEHHWLQEGFATYYALLAEKELFGDDYFYWKLYMSAQKLTQLSKEGKGESLLDPKAGSLTFYEKGAWALHALKNEIGENAFKKAVKNYVLKYKFTTVETNNFLDEVAQVANFNRQKFAANWLVNKGFPEEAMLQLAASSGFVNQLLKVENASMLTPDEAKALLQSNVFYPLKQSVIAKINLFPSEEKVEVLRAAFNTKDLEVRQAVAKHLDSIPTEVKSEFESLLDDKSYVTVENALFSLWKQFPKERDKYLDATKNLHGLNDKSLRMLWLTLALVTEGYKPFDKPEYYRELSVYTGAENHFELRQNAFLFLYQLQAFSDKNLEDLVLACQHPVWQFSKSAKEMLSELLRDDSYLARYKEILPYLRKDAQIFLLKQLPKSQ